jgi:acetyltransferase-like isoleucine patch superfamily enzyme
MAKETATYISQLVATNPVASDSVSVGDDHLRMLKTVLKTQFSGLTGTTAISASEAELNILDGVTATNSELNYLDITTLGTSADSKALTQASGVVTIAGDVVVSGTTPKVTIGDAGEEDTTLLFDGNAKDFYVALDDSADKLVIGEGSTVGTNSILTITDDTVTLGDGAAVDTSIVFDGNAKDFYVGLDDSADKLVVGVDSTVGTNSILTLTDDTVTIGDGAAVDTYLNFDGNAVDFRIGIDDGTDKLEIGAEVAHGTTAAIAIDANADMLLGGYLNFQDEQAIRPEIKDYAETINALGDTGGGTDAIDVSAGNVVTATVSTATQEFTFTNPSATGKACSFTLHLTNGGSQTVNWPNSVDWAGGSAPDLTSSGLDVLTFTTIDAGTTWLGFLAGADVS